MRSERLKWVPRWTGNQCSSASTSVMGTFTGGSEFLQFWTAGTESSQSSEAPLFPALPCRRGRSLRATGVLYLVLSLVLETSEREERRSRVGPGTCCVMVKPLHRWHIAQTPSPHFICSILTTSLRRFLPYWDALLGRGAGIPTRKENRELWRGKFVHNAPKC